jgi:hypothetical protein
MMRCYQLIHLICFLAWLGDSTAVVSTLPASQALWSGRTRPSGDGTARSFDWEGTVVQVTVNGTYLRMLANVTLPPASAARFRMYVDAIMYDAGSFYVHASVSDYLVVAGLDGQTHQITLWYGSEPGNAKASAGRDVTILSFVTDGSFLPQTPNARRVDVIGDSISAGPGYNDPAPCGDPP